MKNLVKFIKEAQIEDFIGSMISLFAMMSYTQAAKIESIKDNIDLLVYVIFENRILFTIADNSIYGTLITNKDNTINLNFKSINDKDEFNETPFEHYQKDDIYQIMSNGTMRDLLNSTNKKGFIKSLSRYYNPDEVVSDNGWKMNFDKNTEI